jgi:hypothetical protein
VFLGCMGCMGIGRGRVKNGQKWSFLAMSFWGPIRVGDVILSVFSGILGVFVFLIRGDRVLYGILECFGVSCGMSIFY